MTALIDADIVAFRCAPTAENDPVEIALIRTDGMMRDILSREEDYMAFLTGSPSKYPFTEKPNFRYVINPEYKANRKDYVPPKHLDACRKFLIEEYGAIVTEGYEADDALGMAQTEDSVIYSIDKDLLMIPGHHYNWVNQTYKEVSELDGLRSFYRSLLTGDRSDNVFGISGIGPVKASKIINQLETEEEMYQVVYDLYKDPQRFSMNCNCLWIWRQFEITYTKRMERRENQELYNERPSRRESEVAPQVGMS